MFSQFFGNYLLENQKITAEQFASCIEYTKANRVKLGLIAEAEGKLSSSQANELNYLQMNSDKRFGDLAVEKGYLTETDVEYLLGRQGNPYLIFVQALQENGLFTLDEINKDLISFQEANHFSDKVMEAIKNADIDNLLPAFVDVEDNRYHNMIGLALRNIIRFVSSYLRIGKGSFVSSISARYLAYQRTTGDYEGFLGFCSDDDGILAIAEGYAKETFGTVDEDALDSVGEFTNCVNGLHAAELSYSNVHMDMMPPELLFDASLEDDSTFYLLPIYVEGKKSNLIAKLA